MIKTDKTELAKIYLVVILTAGIVSGISALILELLNLKGCLCKLLPTYIGIVVAFMIEGRLRKKSIRDTLISVLSAIIGVTIAYAIICGRI